MTDEEELSEQEKIQRIREIFKGLKEEKYSDPNKKYDTAAHQLLEQISEDEAEELIDEFEEVFDKFTYKTREDGTDIGGTICPQCYEVFKNRGGMRNHRTRTHDTILVPEEKIEEAENDWKEMGKEIGEKLSCIQLQTNSHEEIFRKVLQKKLALPHTEAEKEQYYGRFFEAFKEGIEQNNRQKSEQQNDQEDGTPS